MISYDSGKNGNDKHDNDMTHYLQQEFQQKLQLFCLMISLYAPPLTLYYREFMQESIDKPSK